MDSVNPTLLKTAIEAIPLLSEDNFTSWRTKITGLFNLAGLKSQIINGHPALNSTDNISLCTVILAKLSSSVHTHIVTPANEENALLLWKAILKRFVSSEPSNRARVYNQFALITFHLSNIEGFISEVKTVITKMQEVGLGIPDDVVTYKLMRRLPSDLEKVKTCVTNNQENINPKFFLNQMEIFLNKQKIEGKTKSSSSVSVMYTSDKKKWCKPGQHNDAAPHPKEQCYFLHPEL